MRIIEQQMLTAISRRLNWRKSNTEVRIECDGQIAAVYLFDNLIALYFYATRTMRISSAGWRTRTTKSRLNVLLEQYGVHIYQRNGVWRYSDTNTPFIDEPVESILAQRICAMRSGVTKRDDNVFVA